MFPSLKVKIFLLILMIMAATAGSILYFTHRDVGDAMFKAQEDASQSVLELVTLHIQDGYRTLITDRVQTIKGIEDRLESIASVGGSFLATMSDIVRNGDLPPDEARLTAEAFIRNTRFPRGHMLAFDRQGTVVAHSEKVLENLSIAGVKDMKGRELLEAVTGGDGHRGKSKGQSAVFKWAMPGQDAPSKKMGYFLPHPEWGWTLAAIIDISSIEEQTQKRLDKIVKLLRTSFEKIRIAETGYAFLFTGDRNILVLPTFETNRELEAVKNTRSGNLLLDDLMAAADDNASSAPVLYELPRDGRTVLMQAQVTHFRPLDWYIATTVPVGEIKAPAVRLVTRQSVLIGAIFVLGLLIALLMVVHISRPLNQLTDYTRELSKQDFSKETEEETPIDHLPQKYRDEVGRLAKAFVFMRGELGRNVRHLMETTAAKEKMQGELNAARDIQLGILPKTFPAFPDRREIEVFAFLEPAREVGGDLYDFFFVDDDHLFFTVGDVSDKGVPAALMMVITRTLIKIMAQNGLPPGQVMERVNDLLSADNPQSMFVTLVVGSLNIRTGEISYANGGHNPPVRMVKNAAPEYLEAISGPLVGVFGETPYGDLSTALRPGEAIFLYTDGVTEAMDRDYNQYSDERLVETLSKIGVRSSKETVNAVVSDIRDHTGDTPQSDDITILMIRYNGEEDGVA